jgi:integrase
MFEPKVLKSIEPKENEIRKQIEDLRKQLPRQHSIRRKLPDYPTYEDYNKYLLGLKKMKKKPKKEYLLCIVLAYEAGMRISEILGWKDRVPALTPDRVDVQRHTIKIISGKGGKDRIVPLPPSFNERAYKLLPLKISRRAIQWFVTKTTQEILGKTLSIHKFRHGFGSRLANQNVPVHQIQMWMGHSRLDTTSIYLHASPTQENIEKVRNLFE